MLFFKTFYASFCFFFFFFNDTATTEIYTLSLHDALPISASPRAAAACACGRWRSIRPGADRKSTRLNSSHVKSSYAVFCLKKKQKSPGCPARANRKSSTVSRDAGPSGFPHRESRRRDRRFFFNDTATTEIYTLSLHDALPI